MEFKINTFEKDWGFQPMHRLIKMRASLMNDYTSATPYGLVNKKHVLEYNNIIVGKEKLNR